MFDTDRPAFPPNRAVVQPARELGELVRDYILLSPYMPKHDLGQHASFTQCILDGKERRGPLLLSLR